MASWRDRRDRVDFPDTGETENFRHSEQIGLNTSEQKKAIEDNSQMINSLNEILAELVSGISKLTSTSGTIRENAMMLLKKSDEALI